MRHDTRLSRLLHVLLHMAEGRVPLTSQQIAGMLGSNPVVVRRIMAGLRNAGVVSAERGHGGGWSLERDLSGITLLDVYRSLGEPGLFAFGLADPAPRCLVERSVNATIGGAIAEAQAAVEARFAQVRLADIAADVSALRSRAGPEAGPGAGSGTGCG